MEKTRKQTLERIVMKAYAFAQLCSPKLKLCSTIFYHKGCADLNQSLDEFL